MTYPDIDKLLPHDWPMIVIDRVIAHGDDWVETEIVVTENHVFYDSKHDALPSWIIIEIMAQSIAAYAGMTAVNDGRPVVPGFLLGTRKLDFAQEWIARGSVVHTRVASQFSSNEGLGAFNCASRVDEQEIASGVINVYQTSEGNPPE